MADEILNPEPMEMTGMTLRFVGKDESIKDMIAGREVIHKRDLVRLAVLDGRMKSGAPGLAIVIDIGDGKVVVAENSVKLLCQKVDEIRARYPELAD